MNALEQFTAVFTDNLPHGIEDGDVEVTSDGTVLVHHTNHWATFSAVQKAATEVAMNLGYSVEMDNEWDKTYDRPDLTVTELEIQS